mgnify:FL=1
MTRLIQKNLNFNEISRWTKENANNTPTDITKTKVKTEISVNLIFNREGESEKNSSPLFYIIKSNYLLLSKLSKYKIYLPI